MRSRATGELAQHSSSCQRSAGASRRGVTEKTGETVTLMVPAGAKGVTVEVVEDKEGDASVARCRA